MHVIHPIKDGTQKVTVYGLNNEVYKEGTFDTRQEAQQMAELWQRYALFGEPDYSMDEILQLIDENYADLLQYS